MKRIAMNAAVFALALVFTPAVWATDACQNCGIVKTVDKEKTKGGGAVVGGVLGGLLGNQFGHGTGRTLTTVAGAAGGAYAGNEVEKNVRGDTFWNVSVQMDYGELRTFRLNQDPALQAGDRVRIDNGVPVRVPAN